MTGQRSSSSAGVLVAVLAVAAMVGSVAGIGAAKRDAAATAPAPVVIAQPAPASSPIVATFETDAAVATYASLNGEQVPSNSRYSVAPGDVLVLTVQATGPTGTCGIALDGSVVTVQHAAKGQPATCQVVVP